ncbi:FK506-binding protein 1A [Tirmania nivea]|nr:FK506-binding protein 1A [Tirmania nivea]
MKRIVTAGDGVRYPKRGDKVKVHYVGTLANGNKFDSSRDRNAAFEVNIGQGQVIKAWDELIQQMSLGEKAVLTCPPESAYGARGYPPIIPPNATLTL